MQDVVFNIVTLPGKGDGCLANRNIERGTLIFREKALFLTDSVGRELDELAAENNLAGGDLDAIEIEKERLEFIKVINSFLNLSSQEKDRYLRLCCGQPDRRTEAAVRAAFKSFPQSEYLPFQLCSRVCYTYKVNAFNNGIFPSLSKINHSCQPNTEIFWNQETRSRDLVAVADIKPGDEICHNYLQSCWSCHDRTTALRDKWNFTCYCNYCCLGLDLQLMQFVEQSNKDYIAHSGSVTSLTSFLLNIDDLRLIRIFKVLRVLDKIYLHYSIDSLLSPTYCDIIEDVASIGEEYSTILVGPAGSLARTWHYRRKHRVKCAFNCLIKEMLIFILRLLTIVILFHNFWENVVWQYLILLSCSLLYSKL